MAAFQDSHTLADHLFRDAINRLEAASPTVNYFSVKSVGGAARILGFESYADRCAAILQTLPDASFTAGAIANFPMPKRVPAGFRQILDMEQLNAYHPPLTDASVAKYIAECGSSQEHLRLIVHGDYDAAFAAAKTELDVEECASAQAVLGDIESALRSASTVVVPEFRANNVRFICTSELFRRERFDDANQLFDSIYPSQMGPDAAAQMALGANHRLPWLGYPFPDW